jgi:hypothetical protein
VRNRCRACELAIAIAVAAELVVPAMVDVTDANANSLAMRGAAVRNKYSAVRADREVDWDVKAAASDVSAKTDRVDVVHF